MLKQNKKFIMNKIQKQPKKMTQVMIYILYVNNLKIKNFK